MILHINLAKKFEMLIVFKGFRYLTISVSKLNGVFYKYLKLCKKTI